MASRPQALLAALLVLAWPLCSHAQRSRPAGAQAAYDFRPNTVHIVAEGFPDGETEDGFGFVFGQRDGHVFIATADHVVRRSDHPASRIQLDFFHSQGQPVLAELREVRLLPGNGDLAILVATPPPGFSPQWPAMVPAFDLQQGAPGWRIGRTGKWTPPATGGVFSERFGPLLLEFDNLDTPPGSSGGPILGDDGLIGMVVEQADGGLYAHVLPADTIAGFVRSRQMPWDLLRPGTVAVSKPAPVPPTPFTPSPPSTPPSTALSTPPAAPPSTRAALERAARAVLIHLTDTAGLSPDQLVEALQPLYAPTIVYDGRFVRRAELLAQKRGFAETWPVRRSEVSTVTLDCNFALATCRIEATVLWQRAVSLATSRQNGQSQFTIAADFSSGAPQIRVETETAVFHR